MIGSCDNCGKDNVPVFNGTSCGCETTQCYLCNGDIADPYGELDEQLLNAVSEAIKDPILSAEEQLEQKCDWLIRDDFFGAIKTGKCHRFRSAQINDCLS